MCDDDITFRLYFREDVHFEEALDDGDVRAGVEEEKARGAGSMSGVRVTEAGDRLPVMHRDCLRLAVVLDRLDRTLKLRFNPQLLQHHRDAPDREGGGDSSFDVVRLAVRACNGVGLCQGLSDVRPFIALSSLPDHISDFRHASLKGSCQVIADGPGARRHQS